MGLGAKGSHTELQGLESSAFKLGLPGLSNSAFVKAKRETVFYLTMSSLVFNS